MRELGEAEAHGPGGVQRLEKISPKSSRFRVMVQYPGGPSTVAGFQAALTSRGYLPSPSAH